MTQKSAEPNADREPNRWFWVVSPHALWRTPLICFLVPGLLLSLMELWVVSPIGFPSLSTGFLLLVTVPMWAALVGLIVSPFFLFSKVRRRSALLTLLASIAFSISFVFGAVASSKLRKNAFAALAERSKPLIEGVKRYEQEHHRPPDSLDALVPDYLARVPSTGMGAYPKYEYVYGEKAQRFDSNPWAIYVFTPSGGINFDQFMYFPLQNYPSKGYGGWLERIGDWAYVHE